LYAARSSTRKSCCCVLRVPCCVNKPATYNLQFTLLEERLRGQAPGITGLISQSLNLPISPPQKCYSIRPNLPFPIRILRAAVFGEGLAGAVGEEFDGVGQVNVGDVVIPGGDAQVMGF
jgi:hypothetical protein